MKTILFSALAFGACTSLALAGSLPPAGTADGLATGGPVALTDIQMGKVTGGLTILPIQKVVHLPSQALAPDILCGPCGPPVAGP